MTDFDWGDTPLSPSELISIRLEETSDAFATKANKAAIAENEYLRRRQKAYAKASANDVAMTARREWADHQEDVVDAKCDWNLAASAERTTRVKYDETHARLIAALAHEKQVREQT